MADDIYAPVRAAYIAAHARAVNPDDPIETSMRVRMIADTRLQIKEVSADRRAEDELWESKQAAFKKRHVLESSKTWKAAERSYERQMLFYDHLLDYLETVIKNATK